MGIFIGWIIFSIIVGIVGSDRKIGFFGALFVSLLLSPLIGLIITLISKSKEQEAYEQKFLTTQKNQEVTLSNLSSSKNISLSDELFKLKKLRKQNEISEEEFQDLRRRVLNS